VGKELVADGLHYEGLRAGGPFIKVNCAAISESLLESEVFGHEKGAYTGADRRRRGRFEQADGGTLFLDEISQMGAHLQAKLLRVLQGEPFRRIGGDEPIDADVRIVAATNLDPEKAVQDGNLREDLFYRINVIRIDVPPLRKRREDILLLAEHFVGKHTSRLGRSPKTITEGALDALRAFDWPGNVRELENCMERAVVLAEGDVIEARHLSMDAVHGADDSPPPFPSLDLQQLEEWAVRRALEESGWNKAEASRRLGIYPSSLYKKMRRFDIPLKGPDPEGGEQA
jgi:transcriptional regulator with PAS, ATPase and Fis domain